MFHKPNQKQWSDLSARQKATILILGVLQVGLLAAAQRDIHRRSAGEIRGSKWFWRVIALINYFGPVAYFLWGRKRSSS